MGDKIQLLIKRNSQKLVFEFNGYGGFYSIPMLGQGTSLAEEKMARTHSFQAKT